MTVADAEDQDAAQREVRELLLELLSGLRATPPPT